MTAPQYLATRHYDEVFQWSPDAYAEMFAVSPAELDEEHSAEFCSAYVASALAAEDEDPDLDVSGLDPSLPEEDIDLDAELAKLFVEFKDAMPDERPAELPPLRVVNHDIPLIDPSQKINPVVYPIADRYKSQFRDQVRTYVKSGWWSPAALDSASPMFAAPKSDRSKARFVIDLRKRNANTHRQVTPIPDIRRMRENVARAKFRSKYDFIAMFEQIRINPDSVKYSGFKTIDGTMTSNVCQQGDTNAPNTAARLFFALFHRFLERGLC